MAKERRDRKRGLAQKILKEVGLASVARQPLRGAKTTALDRKAYDEGADAACPYCGRQARATWNGRGEWVFVHAERRTHAASAATGLPIEVWQVWDACDHRGRQGRQATACDCCQGRGGSWPEPWEFHPCWRCRGSGQAALAEAEVEERAEAWAGGRKRARGLLSAVERPVCADCKGTGGEWRGSKPAPGTWRTCDRCCGTGDRRHGDRHE